MLAPPRAVPTARFASIGAASLVVSGSPLRAAAETISTATTEPALTASALLGFPLCFVTFGILAYFRSQQRLDQDRNAISPDSYDIYSKIWSARSTQAPGYKLVEEEDFEGLDERASEAVQSSLAASWSATPEAGTTDEQALRALQAALADAVEREDYKAAAEIKKRLDETGC